MASPILSVPSGLTGLTVIIRSFGDGRVVDSKTFALVEPLRAERPKFCQPSGGKAADRLRSRSQSLARFGRNKLGHSFCCLGGTTPLKTARIQRSTSRACDAAAGRLHPGYAGVAHVTPHHWRVPGFLAFGLILGTGFILEVAVR
jgi:hypothetical protein